MSIELKKVLSEEADRKIDSALSMLFKGMVDCIFMELIYLRIAILMEVTNQRVLKLY
jgi:hypothetical protein